MRPARPGDRQLEQPGRRAGLLSQPTQPIVVSGNGVTADTAAKSDVSSQGYASMLSSLKGLLNRYQGISGTCTAYQDAQST